MGDHRLSAKKRVFAETYFKTGDSTEAARAAGYSHPNRTGRRLLKMKNGYLVDRALLGYFRALKDEALAKSQPESTNVVELAVVKPDHIKPAGLEECDRILSECMRDPSAPWGARLKATELRMKRLGAFESASNAGDEEERRARVRVLLGSG